MNLFSLSMSIRPWNLLRRLSQGLVRRAVGACLALMSMQALAGPADNLTDTWKINGNGWPGDLVITQGPTSGRLQGTMYGDRMVGYFASQERTAVMVRYSSLGIPMQAFVGQVSVDGRTWSGRFYGLDVSFSGASQAENVWGFAATRGTSTVPNHQPVTGLSAGPIGLHPAFTIYNRPQEFGTSWAGSLNISLGSIANPNFGQLDGTVFGDEFIGSYAQGTATVAFLRLRNRQPAQLFIGRDQASESFVWRMGGSFYPLTEEMGATPARLTFDWRAIVPQCEVQPCQ